MFREFCSSIYQNKNLIMPVTVVIYIFAILSVLFGYSLFFALILTLLLLVAGIKKYFPSKVIIIWGLIFYLGVVNTSFRLNETDELLNLAPLNSTIYGKIVSIPQNKGNGKSQFFFNVKNIEYDGQIKNFNKEKVLVTLNTEEKLKIYDSYIIRGRLSVPFKAGNPSQFDYGNYLRNFNTSAVFYGRNPYSMKDLDIPCYEKQNVPVSEKERILQGINDYRERIIEIHSHYLKSPNLEILGGIVFGDDAVSPPADIKQSFINSGLLHILAASGMNVAFIYAFFFFILNFLRVPYKINIGICIFSVLTYVLMTGLGASVLRAALMLVFVLIGKLIDRDANSLSLLSFVAFILLLYNPMFINDVGFQLSFTVTFGLLLTTPYIIQNKNSIVNWLIGTVSIPVIAQLWVIPIQIFYFSNISIYSVFANIMCVPVVSAISCCGFLSSLISAITPISHLICRLFDFILNPLITFVVNISDFWGNLPNSTLQTTHPNPVQILIYYLILIILTCMLSKDFREKSYKYIKFVLLSLIVVLLLSTISLPNHNLEITAFDVGNADAFMVKTPDNKYFMIDSGKSGYNGGKTQAEMIILKYFKDIGIKNVDSIIVSHFDNDHCGGVVDMVKNLGVNKVYVNSLRDESNSAKAIYKAAQERNVKIIQAENKQSVYEKEGLKITNFLVNNVAGVGDNESSIITLMQYGKFSMLFTGDAGVETFNQLKKYLPRNITVLKVAHHGAAGVVNNGMADYLNPKISIISTGENKFGHPSVYTIATLRNSQILRTDIHNSIKLEVRSKDYRVFTYDSKKKKYVSMFK